MGSKRAVCALRFLFLPLYVLLLAACRGDGASFFSKLRRSNSSTSTLQRRPGGGTSVLRYSRSMDRPEKPQVRSSTGAPTPAEPAVLLQQKQSFGIQEGTLDTTDVDSLKAATAYSTGDTTRIGGNNAEKKPPRKEWWRRSWGQDLSAVAPVQREGGINREDESQQFEVLEERRQATSDSPSQDVKTQNKFLWSSLDRANMPRRRLNFENKQGKSSKASCVPNLEACVACDESRVERNGSFLLQKMQEQDKLKSSQQKQKGDVQEASEPEEDEQRREHPHRSVSADLFGTGIRNTRWEMGKQKIAGKSMTSSKVRVAHGLQEKSSGLNLWKGMWSRGNSVSLARSTGWKEAVPRSEPKMLNYRFLEDSPWRSERRGYEQLSANEHSAIIRPLLTKCAAPFADEASASLPDGYITHARGRSDTVVRPGAPPCSAPCPVSLYTATSSGSSTTETPDGSSEERCLSRQRTGMPTGHSKIRAKRVNFAEGPTQSKEKEAFSDVEPAAERRPIPFAQGPWEGGDSSARAGKSATEVAQTESNTSSFKTMSSSSETKAVSNRNTMEPLDLAEGAGERAWALPEAVVFDSGSRGKFSTIRRQKTVRKSPFRQKTIPTEANRANKKTVLLEELSVNGNLQKTSDERDEENWWGGIPTGSTAWDGLMQAVTASNIQASSASPALKLLDEEEHRSKGASKAGNREESLREQPEDEEMETAGEPKGSHEKAEHAQQVERQRTGAGAAAATQHTEDLDACSAHDELVQTLIPFSKATLLLPNEIHRSAIVCLSSGSSRPPYKPLNDVLVTFQAISGILTSVHSLQQQRRMLSLSVRQIVCFLQRLYTQYSFAAVESVEHWEMAVVKKVTPIGHHICTNGSFPEMEITAHPKWRCRESVALAGVLQRAGQRLRGVRPILSPGEDAVERTFLLLAKAAAAAGTSVDFTKLDGYSRAKKVYLLNTAKHRWGNMPIANMTVPEVLLMQELNGLGSELGAEHSPQYQWSHAAGGTATRERRLRPGDLSPSTSGGILTSTNTNISQGGAGHLPFHKGGGTDCTDDDTCGSSCSSRVARLSSV